MDNGLTKAPDRMLSIFYFTLAACLYTTPVNTYEPEGVDTNMELYMPRSFFLHQSSQTFENDKDSSKTEMLPFLLPPSRFTVHQHKAFWWI